MNKRKYEEKDNKEEKKPRKKDNLLQVRFSVEQLS